MARLQVGQSQQFAKTDWCELGTFSLFGHWASDLTLMFDRCTGHRVSQLEKVDRMNTKPKEEVSLDWKNLLAIGLSVGTFMYTKQQTDTSERELAVLKEQLQQIERHHDEEITLRRRPFVAFVADSRFYLEESSKGQFGFQHLEGGLVRNANSVPRIKNFGNGPALDIRIEWISENGPTNIAKALDTLHLFPDDESAVRSFPLALVKAADGKCRGDVKISVRDLDGKYHDTVQSFVASRSKSDGSTTIEFTELKSLPYDHSQLARQLSQILAR